MDEITLMSLIAEGESGGKVEFKRELHLDKAEERAEFIRDVISLSNSAPQNKGYLLIGIDNTKYIVGLDKLEEERIQQLVHSHIRPSLKITCTILSIDVPNLPSIGIIEIEGTERPYRVSIPIERLRQDDIFIRHGSVVEKATPEENRRMEDESQRLKEISLHIYAAETHLQLSNFEDALDIYAQAIKTMPSAELFLARGKIYKQCIKQNRLLDKSKRELVNLALKDLSTAIRLTKSLEIEKDSRFERLRINGLINDEHKEWDEDIEWVKDKARDRELGEVLYLEYKCYEGRVGYSYEEPREVFEAMTKSIESGYTEPRVYELRSMASFSLYNYGLALQDIDTALVSSTDTDERIDFYTLRANIQAKMKKFDEAHTSLSSARTLYRLISKNKYRDYIGSITSDIEDELLWRYSLEAEFGDLSRHISARLILRAITDDLARMYSNAYLEKKYSKIIPFIYSFFQNNQ